MVSAFSLALGDLFSAPILRIFAKSLGVTLIVFAVIGGGAWYGLREVLIDSLGLDGGASGVVAFVGTLIALYMLWTAIAFGVIQLFADEVVAVVEARHYPAALAAAKPLGFSGEALIGLRATFFSLFVNILALPIALLFLITGIGTIVVFWLANTIVLGRELMQIAWLRHRRDRKEPRPLSGGERFVLGGIAAAMLLVPFVNLLAPVFGAAMATHMVQRKALRGAK